jgi:hypothetical protein
VNPVVQAPLHLVVDLRTKSGQAAERGLDMSAGAAEPVVKIEMTKGGVEIVAPHQANDTPAEPNTFRVSGGAVDRLRRLDEFIRLVLAVLGGIGRTGGGLAGLIRGRIAALGARASNADQECKPGGGKVAQNCSLKLSHPLTHNFPDFSCPRLARDAARLMPFKWVSNAAETFSEFP